MNKTLLLDLDLSSAADALNHRQEERYPLNKRGKIKVIGEDGRLLIDEVTLEDWSESGCRFVSGIPLKAGDIVAIKPLEKNNTAQEDRESRLFEVTWTNRRIAFCVAGALKLEGEKLATFKFPPANSAPERPSK